MIWKIAKKTAKNQCIQRFHVQCMMLINYQVDTCNLYEPSAFSVLMINFHSPE